MDQSLENTTPGSNQEFGLPEGYFQKSAASVFNKIEWLDEHGNFPGLSNLKRSNPFTVPGNYFEKTEARLELLNHEALMGIEKQPGFTVPENYFEDIEIQELSKVILDFEDPQISVPVLNSFKVSPGYFESGGKQLEDLILAEVKPGRVISLFGTKTWVAAAALLLIAFGLWAYAFYFEPLPQKDCGTIACIEKADLMKAKNLENLETEELYELVNTDELEDQLLRKNDKGKNDGKTDSVDEATKEFLMDEI